jgi:Zn-dependent peptidase ImmA (M78 family)
MSPSERAVQRVKALGLSKPKELDVDLIAMDAGMRVEYQQLEGCEATLLGLRDHAIATINPSGNRGRDRFSIGHELGHWDLHRGQSFRCRVDQPDRNFASDKEREREADAYAAHLLMPAFMFEPAVAAYSSPSFVELKQLALEFDTSPLATSMRLADVDIVPVILACYGPNGRRWSKVAKHIPKRWFLRNQLDDDSFASDFFAKGKERLSLGKQSGEVWFENSDASNYEVRECCRAGSAGEVLVLLYLESSMLYARFDPDVGVRRYTDKGSYFARR